MRIVRSEGFSPGFNLTCINTDKFKTGCLSVNLITPLKRGTAAKNALLPRVLRRGTEELPDMESISAALDELYGACVEPFVRKKGELHCVGLYADFPDGRFLPRGEDIMESVVLLAGKILLSPLMRGGCFLPEYTEGERDNLIDAIRSALNDKRAYAAERLLEEMCADEAYGIHRLGGEDEARAVTNEALSEHYGALLGGSAAEVLYCGAAEPRRVESALLAAFGGLANRKHAALPAQDIVKYPRGASPVKITENLDVSQGKLVMGFRLGRAMSSPPNYPALMVFNTVYGGDVSSKLFKNVREKLALCYYASSSLDKHKGIMVVSSGVDPANFSIAEDEILFQLDEVKRGNVSKEDLEAAKLALTTSVRSAMDRPAGLLELYFDSVVSAVPYDPETLCDMIGAVTLGEVAETASDITLDTTYLLSGSETAGGQSDDM